MIGRVVAKVVMVVAGAALATGLSAAPGQARTVVDTGPLPWAYYYDNYVTGDGASPLILYTGASVVDECTTDYPVATNRVRIHGDAPAEGATQSEDLVTRGAFHLYDGQGLDAVEFIDQVCSTVAAGGEAPEPLAVGSGTVRSSVDVLFHGPDAPPDVTTTNTALGVVVTADGDRWVVRGVAELTLSPDFSVDHVALDVLNG